MRLFRNLLLGLLLLLAMAAGALLLWRERALEAVGQIVAGSFDINQASLTVTEVSLRRIIIENLSLGPGLPSLSRAELRFLPLRLLRGELAAVDLSGLRLIVEGDGQKLVKKLHFLRSSSNDPVRGDPADKGNGLPGHNLPRIVLRDAEILLKATPAGDGVIQLSGELTPGAAGLAVRVKAYADLGHSSGVFNARTETRDGRNIIILDGSGRTDTTALRTQGPFAARVAGVVRQGQAKYSLAGQITVPTAAYGDVRAWLQTAFGLEGRISLDGLQSAVAPETVSGEVAWRAIGDGHLLTVGLLEPAALTVTGLTEARWQGTGLDLPAGETLRIEIESGRGKAGVSEGVPFGDWSAKASASAQMAGTSAKFIAHIAGEVGAARVRLSEVEVEARALPIRHEQNTGMLKEAKVHFDGTVGDDRTLDLAGNLVVSLTGIIGEAAAIARLDGQTRFSLKGTAADPQVVADGLELHADQVSIPGKATLSDPLAVSVPELRYADKRLSARLTVGPNRGEVHFGEAAKPVSVAWGQVKANLNADNQPGGAPELAGSITIVDGAALISDASVQLDQIAATVPLSSGPVELALRVTDSLREVRFTPISVTLSGEREGGAVTIAGAASLHRGRARVPVQLKAEIAAQTVRASFGPAKLAFKPDFLQPADLSPLLKNIKQAAGGLSTSGTFLIDKDRGPRQTATALFEDLSFNAGGVQAEGLEGKLQFASLQPLATAGEQTLSLRRVVAGVPIDNVTARFSIPRSRRGLTVDLMDASASLAGGRIEIGPATYRDGAADLQVGVIALPLEQLLREWKVEGLTGTGVISGAIPVQIRPGGVGIRQGELRSQAPGVIQVDFGSTRETLTNAGDQVDLAVRTLEDFHYETLNVGLSKPQDGELELVIGLNGSNPAVLDGHPFRFNINLRGRLEPILEAIQAGEGITADLLQGGLGR